ncbi:MAG: nucleoside triphosphate pyrophosphatase [Steroidobacteraceae bacterium]
MSYDTIVLASASERRSRLLTQIGVRHESLAADLDEDPRPGEIPADYVQRLARDKALAGLAALGGRTALPVLAADTTVVLDGRIFGKPSGEQECVAMLMALSGRTHEVMTAIALADGSDLRTAMNVSRVTFRALDEQECRRYWATGEPAGKAGGYAVQGLAAVFISRLEGSFSCVMGLPLFETAALLDAAGVRRWQAVA